MDKSLNTKQIIVMRKDLNMRKGKIAAQAAHASLGAILDLFKSGLLSWSPHPDGWIKNGYVWDSDDPAVSWWLSNSFTKICVSVDSEEELTRLYRHVKSSSNLPCVLITDSGKTEFNGVHTKTCIAIGPGKSEDIDRFTESLPLM